MQCDDRSDFESALAKRRVRRTIPVLLDACSYGLNDGSGVVDMRRKHTEIPMQAAASFGKVRDHWNGCDAQIQVVTPNS